MTPSPGAPTTATELPLLRAPVRRAWWTDAVGPLVWASVLVVVALWVSNNGLADLTDGTANWLISLGRLTALVSSDLLLLQLMGMARITWVERALGQDRITRAHRVLGLVTVTLLVAHIVLTTAGYAAMGRTGFWTRLWTLITTAPGMPIAAAGTALLVMIAVLSVRTAGRRPRHGSSDLLHLCAYLGAALALPHQLWTGTDFIASPVATTYWWTLYGFALLTVLLYRVGLPMYRSLSQALVVKSVVEETPGIVSVHVTGPRLAHLRVSAGQFFIWRFCTGHGWTRGHRLSLSAAPTVDGLRTVMATSGDDGERLAHVTSGTRVFIEGPYGRLTPDLRKRPGLVLVGSGLGVVPLISLLHDAVSTESLLLGPATLIRRVHTTGPHALQDELDALTDAELVDVIDLVGRRSTSGAPWLPEHMGAESGPDAIVRLVPDIADSDVYVCGASPWVKALVRDLRSAGVAPDALHTEHFTW